MALSAVKRDDDGKLVSYPYWKFERVVQPYMDRIGKREWVLDPNGSIVIDPKTKQQLSEEFIPTLDELLLLLELTESELIWLCENGPECKKFRALIDKFQLAYNGFLKKRQIKGEQVTGILALVKDNKDSKAELPENFVDIEKLITALTNISPDAARCVVQAMKKLAGEQNG